MREILKTDEEKVKMMDFIIGKVLHEYNDKPPVEKGFHSHAEILGYQILLDLESHGFITNMGIQGK